jgi:hypothetical protein
MCYLQECSLLRVHEYAAALASAWSCAAQLQADGPVTTMVGAAASKKVSRSN